MHDLFGIIRSPVIGTSGKVSERKFKNPANTLVVVTLRKRPDYLTETIKHHLIQTDGDFKIPF